MLLSVAVAISVWVYLSERNKGRLHSLSRKILGGFMSLIGGAAFYVIGLIVALLFIDHPFVGKQAETSRQEVLSLEEKPDSYGWEVSSSSGKEVHFFYRQGENVKEGSINSDRISYTSGEKAVYVTKTKNLRSWIRFPFTSSGITIKKKLVLPENGEIFRGYEPAPAAE
ncbi:MAG: hypothetical protein BRC25_01245 [Parcubacteria group bacterium SW_6_46_9]|nr:MAG: hypothetical protein BRC25_01245 [Parcubacteria group bacterium SW_6_46_9]